jgi:hypothetical protein
MERIVNAGSGHGALARAAAELGLQSVPPSAPLAALGLRVSLAPSDLVLHCDLVRLRDGRIVEAPAALGDATGWIELLGPVAQRLTMELVPVAGPCGLLVYRGGWPFDLNTRNPRDLLGETAAEHRPYGAGDEVMRDLMNTSSEILGGDLLAWPWGAANLPAIAKIDPPGVLAGDEPEIAGLARLIGWRHERSAGAASLSSHPPE